MKLLIITTIPPRQALLGTTPEKHVVEETEAESVEYAADSVHVPEHGCVRIIPAEHVTVVESVLERRIR